MDKINVGIIGCGRIADLHYPGYKNNRDARIYAVCDSDPSIAAARKKEWKAVKAYTDYRELLADGEIGAVEILTPHNLHEPMVIDAARAGKHIAVQKPMTTSLAGADRMIQAAGDAGVVYKVTDNYVWYPPTVLAKKMIENGEIGTPMNLRIKLIVGGSGGWAVPPSSWEWRMREFEAGLPEESFDHGHHIWSTAWYLLGEADRVSAWIDSADGIVDTPATVMWKYKEGMRYGMLENACANQMYIPSKYYANDEWIEITGTHGIIMINRCNGNIKEGPPLSLFNGKWKQYSAVKSDWVEGFMGSTRNFIDAIKHSERPRLTGEEGRQILRFALSVLKSSRERREVFPDELDAAWPALYRWRKLRSEKKAKAPKKNLLAMIGLGGNDAQYAAQAKELTSQLAGRFNPDAVKGWECSMGLHLLADGKSPESKFSFIISNDTMNMKEGNLPDGATFVLHIPAGTWAAILLKKKRIETAFIQGKLKIDGKAEEALKLRVAVGI